MWMIIGRRVLASVGVRFDNRVVRELMLFTVGWKLFSSRSGVRLDSMLGTVGY